MPKTKQQKQEILKQLSENLGKQKAMIFVDYKGLKVGELAALRSQLKEAGARLVVAKKTLLSRVLKEKRIEADLKNMEGQVAAIFAYEDPILPMKTTHTFGKTTGNLRILGGYFENAMQGASQIATIATLPSREEVLQNLVSTMAVPISGFATVLQGNIKGLITILAKRSQASNSTV